MATHPKPGWTAIPRGLVSPSLMTVRCFPSLMEATDTTSLAESVQYTFLDTQSTATSSGNPMVPEKCN